MRRFSAVLLGIALGFSAIASAHSGLRFSSPIDGATLGAAPSVVQLTFVEAPEPSLASIRVLDTSGAEYQTGRPWPVAGDPLSLTIAVRPLDRGVYTVHWRVVSAVDGHASAGGFVFGVQMAPTGPATIAADASVSWLEAAGLQTIDHQPAQIVGGARVQARGDLFGKQLEQQLRHGLVSGVGGRRTHT